MSDSEHQTEESANQKKTPQNYTPKSKPPFPLSDSGFETGFNLILQIHQIKGYLSLLGSVGLEQFLSLDLHSTQRAGPCGFSTVAVRIYELLKNLFLHSNNSSVSILLIINTYLMLFSVRCWIYSYSKNLNTSHLK